MELRIVEFVAVGLQLDAQLPQPGTGLLEIVGRDTALLEKALRTLDLVPQLVVLDLQRLDRQPVIGIIQFGEQLPPAHEIALGDKNPRNLSGRLEAQIHLVGRPHDARIAARRFAAQRDGLYQAYPLHERRALRTASAATHQSRCQHDSEASFCMFYHDPVF